MFKNLRKLETNFKNVEKIRIFKKLKFKIIKKFRNVRKFNNDQYLKNVQ